ncbi:unnamed protein product [Nippostrongylus brasiliensis]|uniref:Uncharacterized protein n=1 Tax=Nippostrongylus brasiliensis TaxID=27835 RepID=A0A0N4Y2H0_NIPBR|nr:unnamed protein product [Nippostrongylus brasiliensis]
MHAAVQNFAGHFQINQEAKAPGQHIVAFLVRSPTRPYGFRYESSPIAHKLPSHCELRDSLRKYKIIKYSASSANETLNELGFVLREIGVPDEILDDIRMQLTRKRTHHQTYQTKERVFYENQVRSSPYLMKLLVKMFYYDYLLFGFPLPEVR